MPRAFHAVAGVEVDTILSVLVLGGRRTIQEPMQNTCIAYLPRIDRWVSRTPMQTARGLGAAVAVGSRVLMLGGCVSFGSGLRVAEVYDAAADTWTVDQDLPEPLHDFCAVAWRDSLLYLLGGGNWSPNSPPSARVWLRGLSGGTWRPATSLPVPLGAACAGITGDTILIAAGWLDGRLTNRAWRGTISRANPLQIAWEEVDSIPARPRCRAAGTALPGRLVISGGILEQGVAEETWSLDAAAGTWRRLADKPTGSSDVSGGAVIGGWYFHPGGYAGVAPYLATNEALELRSAQHDVSAEQLISPQGRIRVDSGHAVRVGVRNNGQAPETFPVSAIIVDSLTGTPVFDATSTMSLDPEASDTLTLGIFRPILDRVYHTYAWTMLIGDEHPYNDTIDGRCRTTVGSDPDGYGYRYFTTREPDPLDFEWLDPASGDPITDWSPNADDGFSLRSIPFGLPFYGDTLREIYVTTNGLLSSTATANSFNSPLPVSSLRGIISPFWDDLNLRDRGAVLELRRTDRVSWTWLQVPRYASPTDRLSFQAVLYADGTLRFNYLDLDGTTTSSTVGIQGRDGSDQWYLSYCHEGGPEAMVPIDSTSVLFDTRPIGIADPSIPACRFPRLPTSTILSRAHRPATLWFSSPPANRLLIFNNAGRRVAWIAPEGSSQRGVCWSMTDRFDRPLPTGIYFLVSQSQTELSTRRIIVVD